MSAPFPPRRETALISWSGNFNTKIGVDGPAYGLDPAQTAEYAMRHDAFVAAHAVANDPATRSPMNIELKEEAKNSLLAEIRLLAGIVQSFPGTTNAKRIDLGLPLRGTEPSPIAPPDTAPLLAVKSVDGRTVNFRMIDVDNPLKRGKPAGVSGAAVFSHVGDTAPAELSDWTFEGNTGRTSMAVTFPATAAPGATVWLAAFWFNPRKQAGPVSDAIRINLPGGSVTLAA